MNWYVYALFDPINGKPFYVGKGRGCRASWHLKTRKDSNWKKRRIVLAIRAAGFEPEVRYLHQNLTEEEAFDLEMKLIAKYGRRPVGVLVNMSDGGEGRSGSKPTFETRQKISLAMSGSKNHFFGKHHSDVSKAKIGAVNKGKSPTSIWRRRISLALKGRTKSLEMRQKVSKALKGRVRSKKHSLRLAEANRGKIISASTRSKLSAALKGRSKSLTTRKLMGEGMRLSWMRRKLSKLDGTPVCA